MIIFINKIIVSDKNINNNMNNHYIKIIIILK